MKKKKGTKIIYEPHSSVLISDEFHYIQKLKWIIIIILLLFSNFNFIFTDYDDDEQQNKCEMLLIQSVLNIKTNK